jgi:putative tryptophan/tyrosine transport system substrate-binding protein
MFLGTLAGGLLAAPLAAGAQAPGKVYHLGILSPAAPPAASDRGSTVVLLPNLLSERGYVEGQNLLIERRFASGRRDRLRPLARELLQLGSDVIVTLGNEATAAAKDATKSTPIVMLGSVEIDQEFVGSLARPGGNITGVVMTERGLPGKKLELLKEAIPRTTRIGVLAHGEADYKNQLREVEGAAAPLGLTLVVSEVRHDNYERAFASMLAARAGALFVMSSPYLHGDRTRIIKLAAQHRLPAIYQWRDHVDEGGLMSYGSNRVDVTRRVGTYVDRILKGAQPASLPVEQPTAYELVINLKTAKALGLTIPQSLLLRADEVIQ